MTNTDEFPDMWWRYREEDRISAEEYTRTLKRIKSGDSRAFEKYERNVMMRFINQALTPARKNPLMIGTKV